MKLKKQSLIDIMQYLHKDICESGEKAEDCFFNKYSNRIYDNKCVFNYDYNGSNCVDKKDCISVVTSCKNQKFNVFCGVPETLKLAPKDQINPQVIALQGTAGRFITFAYETIANECDLQLLVDGKVMVKKYANDKYIYIDNSVNNILKNIVLSKPNTLSRNPEPNLNIYKSRGGEVKKTTRYSEYETINKYSIAIGFTLSAIGFLAIFIFCCMLGTTTGNDGNRLQYIASARINTNNEENNTNCNNILSKCFNSCLYGSTYCFDCVKSACIILFGFCYNGITSCFTNICNCSLPSCNFCNNNGNTEQHTEQTMPHGVVNSNTSEIL